MPKILTPVVDVNGKQTHVWKNPDEMSGSQNRLGSIPAPVNSHAPKSWEDSTLDERKNIASAFMYALFEEHGLVDDDWEPDWKIDFSKSTRQLGTTNFTRRTIFLSEVMLEHGSQADMEDTAYHEVAHAMLPVKTKHGPRWKALCASLGGNPSASQEAPYMRTAPVRGKTKSEARLPDGTLVKVGLGDRLRVWDGTFVTVSKIAIKNFHAISDGGVGYAVQFSRAEQYKSDYEAVLSQSN